MWPFAKRGARAETRQPEVDDLPSLDAFLNNDSVLKVWLPLKLSERIEWLSAHEGNSRPDVMRELLFEHVYGRVALRQLEAFAFERRKADGLPEVMFSNRLQRLEDDGDPVKPRNVSLEMLGKSSDDFKLHLPTRLKEDIAKVAALNRMTTSKYVRKALVLMLLGERFHAEWQSALLTMGASGSASAEVGPD